MSDAETQKQDAVLEAEQLHKLSPEPWAWDGPRHNIHIREAAHDHLRVAFMTSDGPTKERAGSIVLLHNIAPVLFASYHREKGLRGALEKIEAKQYQGRVTVSTETAWQHFQALNKEVCAIYDIARTALSVKERGE